jgi:hypothetical protein
MAHDATLGASTRGRFEARKPKSLLSWEFLAEKAGQESTAERVHGPASLAA